MREEIRGGTHLWIPQHFVAVVYGPPCCDVDVDVGAP
jgi:hypothetical protein